MPRRRRSDADTIESVNDKIRRQEQDILDDFDSLDQCRRLHNEWKGNSRTDDEAKRGYLEWRKLENLIQKRNRLRQEEEQNRLREDGLREDARRREEERRRLEEEEEESSDKEDEESSDQEEESIDHGDEERMIEDRIQRISNEITEQEEAMRRDYGSLLWCQQAFDDVNAGRSSDEVAQEACLAQATLNDLHAELQSAHGVQNAMYSRVEGDDGLTEIFTPLRVGDDDSDIDMGMVMSSVERLNVNESSSDGLEISNHQNEIQSE